MPHNAPKRTFRKARPAFALAVLTVAAAGAAEPCLEGGPTGDAPARTTGVDADSAGCAVETSECSVAALMLVGLLFLRRQTLAVVRAAAVLPMSVRCSMHL